MHSAPLLARAVVALLALAGASCSKPYDAVEASYLGSAPAPATAPSAFAGKAATVAATLEGHGDEVNAIAFTPNGKYLASVGYGDQQICLWNAADGSLADRRETEHRVKALVAAADGSAILAGDAYHRITRWPIVGGQFGEPDAIEAPFQAGAGGITAMALSPNGKLLAVAGWNQPLCLFDAAERRLLRRLLPDARLHALAFAPSGTRLAAGGEGNEFRIFDLARGSVATHAVSKVDGQSSLTALAFSPDGRYLATGHNESTFTVWDAGTMKEIHNHFIHDASVTAAAFSPDGKVLATGQHGYGVYLWNPATREMLARFEEGEGTVRSLAFHPDGRTLAAGLDKGILRLWR